MYQTGGDTLPPGSLLARRYEVRNLLGAGGAGTTYNVLDRWSGRPVALKLVAAERAAILRDEFGLLRSLSHPNLVRVVDFGWTNGRGERLAYFTSELVEGHALADAVNHAELPCLRSAFVDALSALRLLHAAGIRHGDFTPNNILVRDDGSGVLIDLSCAARVDWLPSCGAVERSGGVAGTPGHIAPEVMAGATADHRADLFAVGITLQTLLETQLGDQPKLHDLARKLTAADPDARPASVDEVLEQLGVDLGRAPVVPVGVGELVGRDDELSAIREALRALTRGERHARVIVIHGAEGMGKTRLLETLRWEAQATCETIDLDPTSGQPVIDLLAAAGASCGLELSQILEAWERVRRRDQSLVLCADDIERLGAPQLELVAALHRSLEPEDAVLFAVTCAAPQALPSALHLHLAPLPLPTIRQWLGATYSQVSCERLWHLSGGCPGLLRGLLDDLAAGVLVESDLERSHHDFGVLSQSRRQRISTLAPEVQVLLAWLAVSDRGLSKHELPVSPRAVVQLERLGLAEWTNSGLRLARAGEAAQVVDCIDAGVVRRAHEGQAEWARRRLADTSLSRRARAELAADEVHHLVRAAHSEQARARFDAVSELHELAPREFAQALAPLVNQATDANLELQFSRLLRLAGDTELARARLESLVHAVNSPPQDAARLELAQLDLDAGTTAAAEAVLEELARSSSPVGEVAARTWAQALLKRGSYREAVAVAETALARASTSSHQVSLLMTHGMALGFLGELVSADRLLERAATLLSDSDDSRALIRLHGARAIVAYERGELDIAAEHHSRAAQLAEQHGNPAPLCTALLNLATVHHQRGQWGVALSHYEQALRAAVALGRIRTEALVRFNQAKLYLDLGLFERAEGTAARCEALARGAGLGLIAAEAIAVRGELELCRGHVASARELLTHARDEMAQFGSERERLELDVSLAEVALSEGELAKAKAMIRSCQTQATNAQAEDVTLSCRLVAARVELRSGRPREAAEEIEAVVEAARSAGNDRLLGEAELRLAQALDDLVAPALAAEHRLAARKLWERVACSLPATLRQAFWSHPIRSAALTADSAHSKEPSAVGRREQRLERLLDVNKRLSTSSDTASVLEWTIDAAIELTRAERGFVLLLDDEGARFRVAVARRLDRSRLEAADAAGDEERDEARFSRAIAERVVKTSSPVVTANALEDERFRGHRSVHAMKLRSVLCVPVVAPDQTLGALYLDNRLEQNRFEEEDLEILQAFADQAAIALVRARLYDELERRNRELEQERQRIDELLRQQAAEIDRLAAEVRERRSQLNQRYDYGSILGSSPAMHRLFALLDRVIEADLPVLILGESGTGKELIARAVHNNDSRRSGPMVSVNCAAIPETLFESELFGHVRGAFTGADRDRDGLLVQAHGGTIFLDEIAELPTTMQVKLLRALQEREVRPVGAQHSIAIDVRLIAATMRHLPDEIAAGRFREDLYYRVNGVEVLVPPLRQRREDIPLLAQHFLSIAAERNHCPSPTLTREALERLTSYAWPGNVRQLEHVITRVVVLGDGGRISAADLALSPTATHRKTLDRRSYEQEEAQRIAEALAANRFNVSKVSRVLGIPRATLIRKLKRYGLERSS